MEQGQYGHYARKPTLLYAVGTDIPRLRWRYSEARLDPAVVERMGLSRAKRLGEVGARGGGTNKGAGVLPRVPRFVPRIDAIEPEVGPIRFNVERGYGGLCHILLLGLGGGLKPFDQIDLNRLQGARYDGLDG